MSCQHCDNQEAIGISEQQSVNILKIEEASTTAATATSPMTPTRSPASTSSTFEKTLPGMLQINANGLPSNMFTCMQQQTPHHPFTCAIRPLFIQQQAIAPVLPSCASFCPSNGPVVNHFIPPPCNTSAQLYCGANNMTMGTVANQIPPQYQQQQRRPAPPNSNENIPTVVAIGPICTPAPSSSSTATLMTTVPITTENHKRATQEK
ncbi:hypothetical protein BDB00DRAFT_430733 [Zychaea mexicana]|uniref:uncharacterized protein n=1 Tax=Zychaea mexicana TaxID=64656 RepID=UPI0022FE4429|nr:uncharacterized protein BDB00DRAFT_430733 [Zychaea mexicana]KAI9492566.1 hypothetical protein BDB00DRAFT_430733 [Zychaea mexicana]